jgi:hypothetical protein
MLQNVIWFVFLFMASYSLLYGSNALMLIGMAVVFLALLLSYWYPKQ